MPFFYGQMRKNEESTRIIAQNKRKETDLDRLGEQRRLTPPENV